MLKPEESWNWCLVIRALKTFLKEKREALPREGLILTETLEVFTRLHPLLLGQARAASAMLPLRAWTCLP